MIDRELTALGMQAPPQPSTRGGRQRMERLLGFVQALPTDQRVALREGRAVALGALSPEAKELLAGLAGGTGRTALEQAGPETVGYIQVELYPVAWAPELQVGGSRRSNWVSGREVLGPGRSAVASVAVPSRNAIHTHCH